MAMGARTGRVAQLMLRRCEMCKRPVGGNGERWTCPNGCSHLLCGVCLEAARRYEKGLRRVMQPPLSQV